mmetsp:Transcript_19772/g.33276  ORF Transcript_19772/g.33276 Transcript_19772/m.33276 type:complete len:372 (+) Transcript_19772:601-1716(+)
MAVKFKSSPTARDGQDQNTTTTALLEDASKKLNEEVQKETKKVEHYRTTKNQKGRVRITKPAAGPLTSHGSCHSIQPGGHLSLAWEISSEVFAAAPKAQIVMALTRLGSMNNVNNIIAKTLKGNKSNQNHEVVGGNIAFHAPKAAGYYVFRIFDQTNDETKAQTIATSPVFAVELRGRDVTTNLVFIFNAFSTAAKQSKVDNGAINGLKNVFELMRTTGAIVNKENPPQQLLQDCVQLLLNMMFQQMDMFDVQAELLAAQQEASENPDDVKSSSATGTSEVWQKIRTAQKMHMTTYDCLVALRANKIAMGMLSAVQCAGVHSVIGLYYCPLLSRFFKNFTDLQKACTKEIGLNRLLWTCLFGRCASTGIKD